MALHDIIWFSIIRAQPRPSTKPSATRPAPFLDVHIDPNYARHGDTGTWHPPHRRRLQHLLLGIELTTTAPIEPRPAHTRLRDV